MQSIESVNGYMNSKRGDFGKQVAGHQSGVVQFALAAGRETRKLAQDTETFRLHVTIAAGRGL